MPRAGLAPEQVMRFRDGETQFLRDFSVSEGLGPRFNSSSCGGCHHRPVIGGDGAIYRGALHYGADLRAAMAVESRWSGAVEAWAEAQGGGTFVGLAPSGSLAHNRHLDGAAPDRVPRAADAMSLRKVTDLRGAGLIEAIPDAMILANARARGRHPSVSGRAVRDEAGRVARFGSQLQIPTDLALAAARTFEVELGLDASELAVLRSRRGLAVTHAVADFVRFLEVPPSEPSARDARRPEVRRGRMLFQEIGCTDCHRPSYTLPDGRVVQPYSDFLLHDMGPALDDGVALGSARASEYRTAPLWGVGDRGTKLLHDGRGANLEKTVLWHGGEGAAARAAFLGLSREDQMAMREWIKALGAPMAGG